MKDEDIHSDTADALKALAAGQHDNGEHAPAEDDADEVAGVGDVMPAPAGETQADVQIPSAQTPRAPKPPATMGEHYQRTMVPLLLVVGVLCIAMAAATAAMLASAADGDGELSRNPILMQHGKLLAAGGFVVGTVLLAGAIIFHRSLRRHSRL